MDQSKLNKVFQECLTDKYGHGYASMYSKVFSSTPNSIFEIGIKQSSSHKAWYTLFPEATIYGMDVEVDKHVGTWWHHNPRVMFTFDYSSHNSSHYRDTIKALTKTVPHSQAAKDFMWDVIIDDGDHNIGAQVGTFMVWKDKFRDVYVIEDILSAEYLHVLKTIVDTLGYVCVSEQSTKTPDEQQYILAIARRDSIFGDTHCN